MTTRAVLLTNFVAPYRIPLLQALRDRIGDLRILVSTAMEADRPWTPDWGDLDVVMQRTKTIHSRHTHPSGFEQRLFLHVPYDTLPLLHRYQPNVVLSGELGLRTLQAAIHRIMHPSSRLIIWATLSEHTEQGWGTTRKTLRRFLFSRADAVLVNGPSGARYVAGFGVPSDRIFVVNQPVELGQFAHLPNTREPSEAHRLIFSGRLTAQKGVDLLQHALREWAARNREHKIDMTWVGDGDLRRDLEAAVMPPNLTQRFVGNVQYADLSKHYAQAGALILPSRMDEWGLVVNEAMASGLPVIGSVYSQAVEEMVNDGETGWRINPFDPNSMLEALDMFFETSPDELDQMRERARIRALAITPEGAADRIAAAIRTICEPACGDRHNTRAA